MVKSPFETVPVTRPFLPPIEEYLPYLERIWKSKLLTNIGALHEELDARLRETLGTPNLTLVANGTLALLIALKALGIEGEVITTPYTFPATTHALHWLGLTPVFVDIEPGRLNIDPARIEAAITERTSAILAVHTYGAPCDVAAIERLAQAHGLKVIYDAAHAFGVRLGSRAIATFGDAATFSFHATKVFTTIEGGAIASRSADVKAKCERLRNFGIVDEVTVEEPGINAKLNEFQAAFGLMQLSRFADGVAARKSVDARYRAALKGLPGIRTIDPVPQTESNYSYFPVLVSPDYPVSRDALYERLRAQNILARRYFYPLTSSYDTYRGLLSARPENLPAAHAATRQILCLPIYADLEQHDQDRVLDIIRGCY